MKVLQWWRSGPPRLRLRRRLLVLSAPVAVLLVLILVKSLSVVAAGALAASGYADRNKDELRSAVAVLNVLNVVEPEKVSFAKGNLAVLENRLDEADRQFSDSVARLAPAESCPARVNLELVRETAGDRAAAVFDGPTAIGHYRDARTTAEQAPPGCFAGNTDADPQRRTLRNDALARLDSKIEAAQIPPPPPPPPPADAASPLPLPAQSDSAPDDEDTQLRLDPGSGSPLDRLQQILRDAGAK